MRQNLRMASNNWQHVIARPQIALVLAFAANGLSLPFLSACGPPPATDLAPCSREQLLGYTASRDEIQAHRKFVLPFVSYPFSTKLNGLWGLALTARVDPTGQVACYSLKDEFENTQPLNDERRAVIHRLREWRYAPFVDHGRAVAAIVTEQINERELSKTHVPLPRVPLDNVHITLERSLCFGWCPSYRIDIYGNGRVVYTGDAYVDVIGTHSYRVPSDDVAKLVESLRVKDIWSLRTGYRSPMSDLPTYTLTVDMGGKEHRLEDYGGQSAGMSSSVSDFEHEIDQVARSDMWVHLSRDCVEHLKAERYDFGSRVAADLLARAVANDRSHDDEAMLSLVTLGAPIDGAARSEKESRGTPPGPLIEEALTNHRGVMIDALIARGALKTGGRPDQAKIDAAFRAAIVGGRLELVEKIWEVRGNRSHPALTFQDVSDGDEPVRKQSPATLLLSHPWYEKGPWDGLKIAQWLVGQGCDIKATAADGRTLLHIAADAGDVDFVRYLLDQGIAPSTPGKFGLPALGSTHDEDVAMLLLEAGTDFSRMQDSGQGFRRYAEFNHWQRVVTWLTAHHH
jgi:hypothetical protein